MAERKAVNKYYPPEWTPNQGSINKFRGTHALRERARKLHMGILIIRFEMPYNIWCEGCGNHIGMGVRYNAEKTKVGMYYSTPIYKFRMKCHLCTNHFEIQTDPQNLDYVILNGARRQERRWDPSQNDQVAPEDKDVGKKLVLDPMYKLEHGEEDKSKKKALAPTLARLEEHQERWKDDYDLNKLLRKKFREKKKNLKTAEEMDRTLLTKSSLDLELLPETSDDRKLASLLKLTPLESFEEKQKIKRDEIISRPLFNSKDSVKLTSTAAVGSLNQLSKIMQLKKELVDNRAMRISHMGVMKTKSSSSTTTMPSEQSNKIYVKPEDDKNAETKQMSSLVALEYNSASDDSTQ